MALHRSQGVHTTIHTSSPRFLFFVFWMLICFASTTISFSSVLYQNIYTEQPPVRQFPCNTKYSIIRSKIIVSFEEVLLFKGNPAGWHGPNREENMAGEYVTRLLTFDPELTSWHYNTFVLCIAGAGVSTVPLIEAQEQISEQRGDL